jgi:hypothetical protein
VSADASKHEDILVQSESIKWDEVVPRILTHSKRTNVIRFSISKNKSGSLSGLCYVARDIAMKAGLEEQGGVKVFVNPTDPRQFLLRPTTEAGSYTVSRAAGKEQKSSLLRVTFRIPLEIKDLRDDDFRVRTVKHVVNEAEKSLVVDINWEKSE